MSYQFKLPIFEGPLDLLLHLIKEQKMDIHDIPINEITKQYLGYLDLMEDLNLEVAGEYLVMAAELTRIKSKILLPVQKRPDEEEGDEGADPRAELARRLLDYRRFKDAAFKLRQMEHERQQIFTRHAPVEVPQEDEEDTEETLVDATVFDLFSAFKKVLEQKTFPQDYEVKITTLSVTARIRGVLDRLNQVESLSFEALFDTATTKQEVIVTFLAILELMRMKLARCQQSQHFETIRLYLDSDRERQEAALKDFRDPEPHTLPVTDEAS
ncbi:segregation and condensation protein A [Nitrospina gracilis]|uniref:segregation and condensation protein A n=1 Tax=Nitrospina gracilis TaxID=35801 RepID=UPI001F16C37F|nr:segregation/condensation protein A [Nitrospina gracilis]MCF8720805.1 segregation and condensation protein A [Nitrospina gracilis Nb-211]